MSTAPNRKSTSSAYHNERLDAAAIKTAASGRWLDILAAAGIPAELLNGKGHPCPKCGGRDRFAAFKDVAETGGVICRYCHADRNGDGLAAVAWIRGIDFPAAVRWVADYLRIVPQPQATNGNPQPKGKRKAGRIVATYDYRDESGNVLFQAVRLEPKDFRQRRPKHGGGWEWRVKGVRVVPYRLPELLAELTRPVFVVEGEKDCDNLARIGVLATCNAGGAGKWTAEHSAFLQGRTVAIVADNDEPGRAHARQVAESLQGVAASVRIVELPGLPDKGDASDWLAAGGTRDQLRQLVQVTPDWTPAEPWPDIEPFDQLDLPDFPTHALPQALRRWVEAESLATQTPADLAGLLALAVCSAMIARRVEVEPRPGWHEPVNLFVAVLLEPGNRKSAVFSDATKPLRDLEAELIEAARPEWARQLSDRRQDEARLKRLEKKAAETGDAEARHEAHNLAAELAEQAEPTLPRLLVDDATSEKLGMMLEQQGGRIASMSPEGGVFDLMAGLYSKSGIPQFGVYLMGHSGDDLITDRVSRKAVRVQRPALTCGYAMQPAVVEGLAENTAFRGRGLLARFLYAAPQSWIGRRLIAPPPVPVATREAYWQTVRRLAEGIENTEYASEPFALRLTAEAQRLLVDWEADIETMLAEGGQMEVMRDWGAKLVGETLRLAAVLHCVEHGPTGSIQEPTIAAAVEVGRYLIPHAEAVLAMMKADDGAGDTGAQYVLRWILRHGRQEFTKREAHQHGRRRFPKADDIDPALAELVQRGYIRLQPQDQAGPGRPPSPRYAVNPAAFQKAENRTHYSQNPLPENESSNCKNTEYASGHFENDERERVTI